MKAKYSKASAERVVKDIRRATRKQYGAEEKINLRFHARGKPRITTTVLRRKMIECDQTKRKCCNKPKSVPHRHLISAFTARLQVGRWQKDRFYFQARLTVSQLTERAA